MNQFKNWLSQDEDINDRIKMMIDSNGFILFFKKDDDIYGAPEDSRVIFARMKKPDKDTSKDWADEAHFIAINLTRAIIGDKSQHMFSKKDLKSIHVIDKEDAEKDLSKHSHKTKKASNPLQQLFMAMPRISLDKDQAPNMMKLKDKKK